MSNVTIKTLTAVHVGSERKLTKSIDFIFFSSFNNKPLAILDENKIYTIVTDTHFEKWINNIQNRQDLLSLLRSIKNDIKPEDIAKRITYVEGNIQDKTFIYEHIHNGLLKPYIPGSSLKGAIRTALLAQMITQNPNLAKRSFNLKNDNHNDTILIKSYFADNPERDAQNKDFLRFLQVGDVVFQNTKICKVCSYNMRGEEWEERDDLSQWTEVIPTGASASTRINLWNETVKKSLHTSIQSEIIDYTGKNHTLISDVQTFTQTLNTHLKNMLEKEIDFIRKQDDDNLYDYRERLIELLNDVKQCKNNECVLRLGKHIGFNFMTGNWQEKVMNDNEFYQFKTKVRPKGDKYAKFPLPKTRRFLPDGTPLGFIKIIFN